MGTSHFSGPVYSNNGFYTTNSALIPNQGSNSANLMPGGAVRIVSNMIAFDKLDLTQWSTIITNGTITFDTAVVGAARKATCTATASTARAILATTVTLVAGRKYYFRCKVEGMVGSPSTIIWTNGISTISTATISSNGVVGLVFTADTSAAATFRIGLNPGGAAGNAGDSVTISEPTVGLLTSAETAPAEYVPPSNSVSFPYANLNTLVSGRVTDVVGVANVNSKSRTVLISGDSLVNNTNDFGNVLYGLRPDLGVVVNGIPGATGATYAPTLSWTLNYNIIYRAGDAGYTDLLLVAPFSPYCDKPSILLWEFGINDILQGRTLAQLQDTALSVINTCLAAGVKVVIFDATPCYGNPAWTLDRELVRQQYNLWISNLTQSQSVRTFSIAKILGSASTYANFPYDTLQAAYDTVDAIHIHPNLAGSTAVANALSAILI